ncbi:hypothetical protein DKM44_10695 [Deinococcus irradiatisoli]|uniref:2'-5' RNA ligase family protein n=1 Tax=Deinococcus irradiatisoli TaxID=2202254 RepID=A0A2Z3JJZ9_9DEIO|nr:hypothetical protein [Deinococcus irradiatisoli]AWN23640.1 hypothetical protein DKM44_10695 [Deinococcus irradiatisoli]
MTDPAAGTRFAVYVVPPADSAYYRLGSQLLGHDLRARRALPLPDFLRAEWQNDAGPYGFHLTVVEGFYTSPDQLPAIAAAVRACLACLAPDADLKLSGGHIEAWDDATTWVQRFEASPALLAAHVLLLSQLAPFVSASPFDAEVAAGKWSWPFEQARMRLLHTPRGLDTYQPHFTLVQPYGGDPDALRSRLEPLTRPYGELRVETLALCLKPAGQTRWQILEEFGLPLTSSEAD